MLHPASYGEPRQGLNSPSGDTEPLTIAVTAARTLGISAGKPYHYGFNCRPRQVRSYEIERTVEAVTKYKVEQANALLASRILAKWAKSAKAYGERLRYRNARGLTMTPRARKSADGSLTETSDRLDRLEAALKALGVEVTPHWHGGGR